MAAGNGSRPMEQLLAWSQRGRRHVTELEAESLSYERRRRAGEAVNTVTVQPVEGIITANLFGVVRRGRDEVWTRLPEGDETTRDVASHDPLQGAHWAVDAHAPSGITWQFMEMAEIDAGDGPYDQSVWVVTVGAQALTGVVVTEINPAGRVVSRWP